ncbi:MAG: ribokinase [Anaerolineae bacterium]|nr:ribokinase [Anaerolineae bacterium]NUQ02888.1 ribokinase [Anaerolineae bacterium]
MAGKKRPKLVMVGSSNIDLVAYAPHLPAPGETLHGSRFSMGFGGKGANQAVMAAKLGAEVTVITKLGRDIYGDMTLANYRSVGVSTEAVLFDDTNASGVALIVVNSETGQNNIVIVGGANDMLSADDVQRSAPVFKSADAVMCQLETPIDATLEAFRIARAAGVITLLNPAPAAALPEDLLALTDWLIPNEIEAEMLTGGAVRTRDQAITAAQALQSSGPKNVIITLGERGALLVLAGGSVTQVAVEPVKAVDTTGAGDSFVGSFAYLLAAGFSPTAAARNACAIAARSVLKPGTQSSFPARAEVLDLLTPTR